MKHETELTHDYSEPWDVRDERLVLSLAAKNCTYAEIAERMGRTPAAVRSKLYRLRHG